MSFLSAGGRYLNNGKRRLSLVAVRGWSGCIERFFATRFVREIPHGRTGFQNIFGDRYVSIFSLLDNACYESALRPRFYVSKLLRHRWVPLSL